MYPGIVFYIKKWDSDSVIIPNKVIIKRFITLYGISTGSYKDSDIVIISYKIGNIRRITLYGIITDSLPVYFLRAFYEVWIFTYRTEGHRLGGTLRDTSPTTVCDNSSQLYDC